MEASTSNTVEMVPPVTTNSTAILPAKASKFFDATSSGKRIKVQSYNKPQNDSLQIFYETGLLRSLAKPLKVPTMDASFAFVERVITKPLWNGSDLVLTDVETNKVDHVKTQELTAGLHKYETELRNNLRNKSYISNNLNSPKKEVLERVSKRCEIFLDQTSKPVLLVDYYIKNVF